MLLLVNALRLEGLSSADKDSDTGPVLARGKLITWSVGERRKRLQLIENHHPAAGPLRESILMGVQLMLFSAQPCKTIECREVY